MIPISTRSDPCAAPAGRFVAWLAQAQVMNVMGSGPVPSYDPPKVPAGSVVGGSCSGKGVLTGPPF
ncbi:MAG TPA: hypothetical protein VM778_13660 [Gemmatimonadota bacterium]|nr:hypothetical protein [Gemmatimonadota bacterium]